MPDGVFQGGFGGVCRCTQCGVYVFVAEVNAHICDPDATIDQRAATAALVAELHGEFGGDGKGFRWEAFDEWLAKWLESPAGQFEVFYRNRPA